ncbi:thioredoxin [candidate division WWE3 bacterium RIFOXYC2_FULL_42_13]|uniref:Thioredoxin n=2 Tax=Katanobacteria TaxID=422282 RepID=A0A0G1HEU5_UNCKA|nr:MAG: Thioredoxin [candidate division WWE3 bacterium GW2011_GWB2_43_22]OGC58446.1 MAG: thioredoxin [candidate division WWE3 bacterium RIFOXYA2_FULL_43_12]OGC65131.1 MAG: thioredoxin [candidate division WWE3 bacterium RIFOXYA12_FULL_43_11]OGC73324.1 MAG: thioredoxin [candidate division WWE3 bacterium RIFOXYB2_FULL_43_9]OGC73543.1 MAG: thioredoxin [candidate division WWE3 bacterium RIFOXYC2_FULL_42_13]OGC74837.1 MAG: thioredoxin [candidate division WWE3 bacterium RIFOXYD2_FULL_43_10]
MVQLLDFYADWCGPCKIMAPVLEEVEKELGNKLEVKRVDVEAEGAMAQEFGIFSIPTFVIMKEGKEVSRKEGAMPKEMLRSWINSHL